MESFSRLRSEFYAKDRSDWLVYAKDRSGWLVYAKDRSDLLVLEDGQVLVNTDSLQDKVRMNRKSIACPFLFKHAVICGECLLQLNDYDT